MSLCHDGPIAFTHPAPSLSCCCAQASPTKSHKGGRIVDGLALGYDSVRRKTLVRPAERDAFHDHLIVRDSGMLTHHGRLHDPLAVDDGTESARPCGVDQRGCHGAAVEGGIVAGREL